MKVQIKNLKFQCIIGILKEERKTKQKVIVNIKFNYNYKKQNFIDYSEVAQLVEQNLKKQRFGLIEDAILDTKDYWNINLILKN